MTMRVSDLSTTVGVPGPAVSKTPRPVCVRPFAGFRLPLVQAVLIAVALYVMFEGWHRDINVPIGFVSDSLWYSRSPRAPSTTGGGGGIPGSGRRMDWTKCRFHPTAPSDQVFVWLVSRFVPDAFAAINVTWVLLVVLSGLSATWCIRALGTSTASAFAAGTLFALSPYALYRNIDHFALVIYLVPFACAAALWLAAGEPHQTWGRTKRLVMFGGCVLLGINYVYFAFFGSFCILVGALIGYFIGRDTRVLASGALCVALITGSTVVNLSPTFYSWYRNGQPLIVHEKVPAEAETFGLKIRQLVSPVFPHRFPPFNRWVERKRPRGFRMTTRTGRPGLASSEPLDFSACWRSSSYLAHGAAAFHCSRAPAG